MGHHHHHDPRAANQRRLALTLGLVLVYMVAEVVGGLLTGSLALLADAGHMLSDAAALALAVFAIHIARRPADARRTYGYHRAEILAALTNGVTLVVIALFILREAWERFRAPQEVLGGWMMAVATGGLLINLGGMWLLHGGRGDSLNLRGAWLHVASDALGSVQAIVAGALIALFGWHWADPLASVLIALLVAWSSWALLKESVGVLMEGTPQHIDVGEVDAAIRGLTGVEQVHDLHVWTITSGRESLSAHVRVGERQRSDLLAEIRRLITERFGIEHVTIQLEPEDICGQDCA